MALAFGEIQRRPGIRPEDPDLLDDLRCARAAIGARTIGSYDDQRQATIIGFHDGGEELRGRGARSRHHGNRMSFGLYPPERKKRGRSLFKKRMDRQAHTLARGDDDRGVARSRADADLA